jgi:hypothetical protein
LRAFGACVRSNYDAYGLSHLAAPHFYFIAWSDGEQFARNLRNKLEQKLALWQDRTEMEGGKNWWNQIEEALKVRRIHGAHHDACRASV